MNINAKVDDSLVIKGSLDTDFGSIGNNNININTMHPSTSNDGVHFGKLGTAVKVENAKNSGATWSDNGSFKTGDIVDATNSGSDYYYAESVYTIKSIGSETAIYASNIEVTDSEDIFNAVRVSVTIKDKTGVDVTKVYNPNSGSNTDSKVGHYASPWTLDADTNIYTNTTNADIWTLAADTEYNVTIRLWFEGQDVSCYTENVKSTGTSVTVDFTKYTE